MARRKPKSRIEFLAHEKVGWEELGKLTAGLPKEAWTEPGAAGQWSLKDIWAHLADWMRHSRRMIPRVIKGELVPANIQDFNREHYERNRRMTLAQALRRTEQERSSFISFIKKLPEEQLLGNRRVYTWASFACYNHYDEHVPALTQFRRAVLRRKRR